MSTFCSASVSFELHSVTDPVVSQLCEETDSMHVEVLASGVKGAFIPEALTSQFNSTKSPNSVCPDPCPALVGAVCGVRAQQPAHGRGVE